MTDHADHPESFNPMLGVATSAPESVFPSEVFSCPYCGQMLGAACRVCVACKRAIDPAEIQKSDIVLGTVEPEAPQVALAPAKFSWPIFFLVFLASWLGAIAAFLLSGRDLDKTRLILSPLPLISALWVIYDANRKGVAKPLRWGLGSLFMWLVFFPWYLSRRRTPKAPAPFVEGTGMWVVLLVMLAVQVVILLVSGPIK
jgi:hypothetical protein